MLMFCKNVIIYFHFLLYLFIVYSPLYKNPFRDKSRFVSSRVEHRIVLITIISHDLIVMV